jgi:hypothetical protein
VKTRAARDRIFNVAPKKNSIDELRFARVRRRPHRVLMRAMPRAFGARKALLGLPRKADAARGVDGRYA